MWFCLELKITFLLLNLFQVYRPLPQGAPFNLTVRGYRGDSLIFTNSTALPFSLRNVSSFILTDRSRYQPGDAVKVRVVSLGLDHLPHKGRVETRVLVGVCPLNKDRAEAVGVMADALLSRAGSQRGSGRATGGQREPGDCAVGILSVPDGSSGTLDGHSFSPRKVELRLASLHEKPLRPNLLFAILLFPPGCNH